jgi:phosphoribosylformylglycinamidine synthase II
VEQVSEPGDGGHLHRELGLTDDEAASIEAVLGRAPNPLELAMYAVMWSEHCSYKSSKIHLRRLPTSGERVLVGPGENAGVVDAGDGVAVAVRIESHNHPSAVEPYQGAATGVGGILRDIFTMGARPVALVDPLRFGPLEDARSRWMLEGVVSGIAGYGNSVGVPTVGGEVDFDPCYASNPLVNVLCLGVMPTSRLVLGRASGVGNLAVLLGATTGRDGIGGVSVLASAGFAGDGDDGEESQSKLPSVQVGDPFEEKRLIEACLELLDAGLVVGIQDLGGAGLTCATSETASRAGLGMDVDVTAVPLRQPGLEPLEVMTSESQERMLAIVTASDLDAVLAVCRKWEVRASVVGRVTAPVAGGGGEAAGRLRVLAGFDGAVLADVPAASLAEDAPVYDRPRAAPADLARRRADDPATLPAPADCGPDLVAMLADTSWIFRQYDHQLFLNTVVGPGGDAALLRLAGPGLAATGKGVAVSADGCGRWCALDPRRGTAMLVAEACLNVACAGAAPVAVVNCLNFGNPEHPEVMWQLSEAVDGMAEACTALGTPVVGGNVSFYNESGGADIDPTPVVAVLGLVDDLRRPPPGVRMEEGSALVLVGPTSVGLGGSRWSTGRRGHRGGALPPLDLAAHAALVELVVELVGRGGLHGVHDVSDGGLGLALAEMSVRSGVGFSVGGVSGHGELFSEGASRVVVATADPEAVLAAASRRRLPARVIGRAGGDRMRVEGLVDLPVDEAGRAWRDRLGSAMDAPS